MLRQKNNGHSKTKNVTRLSASDLSVLRDFTRQTLDLPPAFPDNRSPLAEFIEQNPDSYRNAVELLSQGQSPWPEP